MKSVGAFLLAAAGSVFLAGAARADEWEDDRDRTLVVSAHALDGRQTTVQRPVSGATVGVYTRRVGATPIYLAQAVTDGGGRARLRYSAPSPGTFRVLATGSRAEVRAGSLRADRGGLLDLTLGAVTWVDTSAPATEVRTGTSRVVRPLPFSLPVLLPGVRYEKELRLTGESGTTFMILDLGDRALVWLHQMLSTTPHVRDLRRVPFARVTGFGGDVRQGTQGHVVIGRSGPLHPEVVLLGVGQLVARRVLHRQLLTQLADANLQDVYSQGRQPTARASTATAQGLAALLATLLGDWLVARDGALLRVSATTQGTQVIASQGGDRHAGCGLEAPAGLGQARAEFAALGERSVQNVFCGLWDLVDEADGDTDGVVAGASDQVDGRRLGSVNGLVADLHDASLELPEGTATLSLQEAWTRRLRARYGVAGEQALRLNGVVVR